LRSAFVLILVAASAYADESPVPARLTLKQAIDCALTRNPRVLEQLEELSRADAQVEEVRAGAFPTLVGNGLYTRIDGPRVIAAPGMAMPPQTLQGADAVTANITATLPLVAPQRWVQWAHARAGAKVAALAVGDVRRQVALGVANAYVSILSLRRQVELNVRARDTAGVHAEYTHKRLAGGMGSRLDDVRAQQELESDEARVVAARLALVRAQEALGILVAAEAPVDVIDEPMLATVDAAQAADEAPRLRVDLVELEARRVLALRVARDDWADYMPSLALVFSPIYTWPSTVFTPTWSWQMQLALTVPLYDGGLRYGLAKERRALVRQASLEQTAALRQMRSDLRVGGEAVRQSDEALARARAAAQLAHDAVGIADLAYHAGATTNIELIDAERRARDADTAAAIAEDAARQARLDLLFAAGRLP
jgi:outer membrane protein TolC